MKVLVVGNYPKDAQESMQRFASVLGLELTNRGIQVERLCPQSVFGRFHRGDRGGGKWLGYLDKLLLFPRKLRKRVRRFDVGSIVHICDHSNAVYTRVLAKVPHLVTCHDLLAVRSALGEFPGRQTSFTGRIYQKRILSGLNTAECVACVSSATRRDLLRLSSLEPRQTTVVQNGLNYPYAPLPQRIAEESLNKLTARGGGSGVGTKLKPGFILHVGGNQWYKNRPGVIQIYARLCRNARQVPSLVMVGKPFSSQIRRCIAANRLEERVVEFNAVSNEDLRILYCAAGLFLFPSFEEGFGWPIVEAQACGCPVVTTGRPPMSDIGGDAAAYLNFKTTVVLDDTPLSNDAVESAANTVLRILLEPNEARQARVIQGQLNASRFSAAKMAEDYTQLYTRMLGRFAPQSRRNFAPVSVH